MLLDRVPRRAPGRPARRRVPTAVAVVALGMGLTSCAAGPEVTPRITPGTAAAPREVNVITREWTFVPPVVDLVPGETVVLHVVNGGTEIHEAVFGPASTQQAWESAEAAAGNPPPGPTPAVSVPPDVAGLRIVVRSGERVDAMWTVPLEAANSPGYVVGCHIAGHFDRGMVVPVRWVLPGFDHVPGIESDRRGPTR